MKLFYSPLSPYVRKVMITAHELGLADRIEKVELPTTPLDPNPDVVGANPVGRIPALVTEDHGTLMDSRVICQYLNHLGGGSLYGNDPDFRLLARAALAEGITDSSLLAAYEARMRPEEKRHQPWVDAQYAKILSGLKAFDARVDELGGDLTIDQIALISALGHIDFRHGQLGWEEQCPALADWYASFAGRPSVQATVPVA